MSLRVVRNAPPKTVRPRMKCDEPLDPKLDLVPLLSYMNKTHTAIYCGSPGEGKTTKIEEMLSSNPLFKKVYHEVFLIMPPNSRGSVANSCFRHINQDNIYDELNLQTLEEIYEKLEENAENEWNSLIVFDDVQQFLKDKEVVRLLTHLIANRRHLHCCQWFADQNWIKMPKPIRVLASDVFAFGLSKEQMETIYKELVDIPLPAFDAIQTMYRRTKEEKGKSSLYINVTKQKFFIDWDEIKPPEEELMDIS